jgi:hypothetical protein
MASGPKGSVYELFLETTHPAAQVQVFLHIGLVETFKKRVPGRVAVPAQQELRPPEISQTGLREV